jgi:carboxyl-terminal processing protease
MDSYPELTGAWLSRGYGWLLEITARGWTRWDVTDRTVIPADRGRPEDFAVGFDRVERPSRDVLSLYAAGEITRYTFDRLHDVPAACRRGGTPSSADPEINFEAFCQQFHDHYALFELKNVDWEAEVACHRPGIASLTTDTELLNRLARMIEPLRDNHVAIYADGHTIKASKIARQRASIERALGTGPYWDSRDESNRKLCALLNREFLDGRGRRACNDLLLWGEPVPGVGYLAVLGLFAFADDERARRSSGLPQTRRAGAEFLAADLAALAPAIDRSIRDLQSCRAIIVDARINGGGFDTAALAIAARFADHRQVAFTKHARSGDGILPLQKIFIEPSPTVAYAGPVYLLTSPVTGSAAEILTLGLMSLPQVTRMGEPTLGILSDDLHKCMPNGWEVTLSNEIYRAPDGALYEDIGIPPQIEVPVFPDDHLLPGLRLAFDRALSLADGAA